MLMDYFHFFPFILHQNTIFISWVFKYINSHLFDQILIDKQLLFVTVIAPFNLSYTQACSPMAFSVTFTSKKEENKIIWDGFVFD